MPAVVATALALTLLYIGFIRVFKPDVNQRMLVIGVCLIAVAAAVCLNAFTLGTVTESARNSERAVGRVQRQRRSAGDIGES